MATGDEIQVVVFRVGPQEFALDIFQIERILRYEKPAVMPNAPAFLEGVIQYGGAVVPVVDLRKRLEVPATASEDMRVVVIQLEDQRVGLIVDQVVEVTRVDSTTITAPPPIVRGLAAEFIAGVIARPNRTIILLQAGKLLNSRERIALTALEPATATAGAGAPAKPARKGR